MNNTEERIIFVVSTISNTPRVDNYVGMWGALESMRMIPELDHTGLLQLPEDFEPLIALAVGYPVKELEVRELKHRPFECNRI